MLRIFIVDQAISYRSRIEKAIEASGAGTIVGSSRLGSNTFSLIKSAGPDFLILDLSNQVEYAFDLLKNMRNAGLNDVRVIALLSDENLKGRLHAMGCRDFFIKKAADAERIESQALLAAQIAELVKSLDNLSQIAAQSSPQFDDGFEPMIVVIASSTGGPLVLEQIFANMRPPLKVPILITQHMPETFTRDLANRLASVSHLHVREAIDGEEIATGTVYVAPGNFHMRLVSSKRKVTISLDQGEKLHSVRPAADYLFQTAADIYGSSCMGIVLTGMGVDGAAGARYIRKHGGRVIIQDKKTSVVWGMPGAVYALGAYDAIGNSEMIAESLARVAIRKSA